MKAVLQLTYGASIKADAVLRACGIVCLRFVCMGIPEGRCKTSHRSQTAVLLIPLIDLLLWEAEFLQALWSFLVKWPENTLGLYEFVVLCVSVGAECAVLCSQHRSVLTRGRGR